MGTLNSVQKRLDYLIKHEAMEIIKQIPNPKATVPTQIL